MLGNSSKRRKAILFILLAAAVCFAVFIYSETHKEVVLTSDIHNVEINPSAVLQKETVITAEVELDTLESVAFSTPTSINEIVYITTMKKLSVFPANTLKVELNTIENLDQIEKIILIGGDLYSDTGQHTGISAGEFENIVDQQTIWEKQDIEED